MECNWEQKKKSNLPALGLVMCSFRSETSSLFSRQCSLLAGIARKFVIPSGSTPLNTWKLLVSSLVRFSWVLWVTGTFSFFYYLFLFFFFYICAGSNYIRLGRRFGLIQDATIMFIGLLMLTAAWGVTLNGWVICYAWSLFFYGIGVGKF